jgi:hypothetical protein
MDLNTSSPNPVAHSQEVVRVFDVEGEVLKCSPSNGVAGIPSVGHTEFGLDFGDLRHLDECDGRVVVESQERVHGTLDPMHPVKSDQLHSKYVGKKRDLRF